LPGPLCHRSKLLQRAAVPSTASAVVLRVRSERM
jgi:hypothetical protein